jgi:hypothetical protein
MRGLRTFLTGWLGKPALWLVAAAAHAQSYDLPELPGIADSDVANAHNFSRPFEIVGFGGQSSTLLSDPTAFINFGQVITVTNFGSTAVGSPTPGADSVRGSLNSWGAVGVACGEFHTLLLRRDGRVMARGWNAAGQAEVPSDLTNVVAIAAGADHSLALRRNGEVVAWGWNSFGQADVPKGLEDVRSISAGGRHSLALRRNGQVVAWGDDSRRQTQVPESLGHAVAIAAGGEHSLALLRDGTVMAWGGLLRGQTRTPTRLRQVVEIAAGGFFSLARLADGTVVAWGDNSAGQTNVPPEATNVVQIAAGAFHCLALRADGTVVAWGESDYGAASVDGLRDVVAVAAGGYHSQALVRDGPALVLGRRVTDGRLMLDLTWPAGRAYALEASSTLGEWRVLERRLAVPGEMQFAAPDSGGHRALFYRVRPIDLLPDAVP